MIYQICDAMMSIGTLDRVHIWIHLLYHNSLSYQTWPADIYIHTNLPVNAIDRLPHPRSGDSQDQETFLAPSADKQTRNYDTECSNHHPSISTLRSKGLSRRKMELYIKVSTRVSTNGLDTIYIYKCVVHVSHANILKQTSDMRRPSNLPAYVPPQLTSPISQVSESDIYLTQGDQSLCLWLCL